VAAAASPGASSAPDNRLQHDPTARWGNESWGYTVGSYDKEAGLNNQRLYLNGIRVAQMSDTQPIYLNSAALGIGRHVSGLADPFNGHIDEFRIAHIERSDGWIATTYNNMSNPGVFALAGGRGAKAAGRRRLLAPVRSSDAWRESERLVQTAGAAIRGRPAWQHGRGHRHRRLKHLQMGLAVLQQRGARRGARAVVRRVRRSLGRAVVAAGAATRRGWRSELPEDSARGPTDHGSVPPPLLTSLILGPPAAT
jgi:hypothetical protein